jgi:hypothetical protein
MRGLIENNEKSSITNLQKNEESKKRIIKV